MRARIRQVDPAARSLREERARGRSRSRRCDPIAQPRRRMANSGRASRRPGGRDESAREDSVDGSRGARGRRRRSIAERPPTPWRGPPFERVQRFVHRPRTCGSVSRPSRRCAPVAARTRRIDASMQTSIARTRGHRVPVNSRGPKGRATWSDGRISDEAHSFASPHLPGALILGPTTEMRSAKRPLGK